MQLEDELARDVVDLLLDEAARSESGPLNRERLAKRLKVRREGTSAEDQFLVLVDWLGHCELAHRFDQIQVPPSSRDEYRVADVFVVFKHDDRRLPVLVEVKSTTQIVWTERYVEQKARYARALGLPLLLAWYHWPSGFWTLCDWSALQRRSSGSGYELPLTVAFMNNLMSCLAGDFSYSLAPGLALRLGVEMIEPVDPTPDMPLGGVTPGGLLYPGTWKGVVREAYFEDAQGRRFTDIGAAGMLLFVGTDQVAETSGSGKLLTQSFVIPDRTAQFAHRVLALGVAGMAGLEKVSWRGHLRKPEYGITGQVLFEGATEARARGIVERVYRWRPKELPSWLAP